MSYLFVPLLALWFLPGIAIFSASLDRKELPEAVFIGLTWPILALIWMVITIPIRIIRFIIDTVEDAVTK